MTVAYVVSVAQDGTMTATANGVGFTCTFSLDSCFTPGMSGLSFIGSITVPTIGLGSAIGNGSVTE